MERQAFNSLNEAALQVQLGESAKTAPKPAKKQQKYKIVHNYDKDGTMSTQYVKAHVEYDEVDAMVLEYFENYFGDNLNEDTSDEDITEAVYDLVELCDAVCEAIGLKRQGRIADKVTGQTNRIYAKAGGPGSFRASSARDQSKASEVAHELGYGKKKYHAQRANARRRARIEKATETGSAEDIRIAKLAGQHMNQQANITQQLQHAGGGALGNYTARITKQGRGGHFKKYKPDTYYRTTKGPGSYKKSDEPVQYKPD